MLLGELCHFHAARAILSMVSSHLEDVLAWDQAEAR
jgi:hypothetical protein